jgi:hypothetical protein
MNDVGINENYLEGVITLYPNPNNGTFFIATDLGGQSAVLEIVTVTGQVVYTEQLDAGATIRKELSLELSDGSYLVRITLADGTLKPG